MNMGESAGAAYGFGPGELDQFRKDILDKQVIGDFQLLSALAIRLIDSLPVEVAQ